LREVAVVALGTLWVKQVFSDTDILVRDELRAGEAAQAAFVVWLIIRQSVVPFDHLLA